MKVFAPFRFDPTNQCLWRRADTGEEARVLLAPKAFALLNHLVEHAGQLVTHEELLDAVWPGSVVEPQAVKRHILAVRSALGDRPKNSLFLPAAAALAETTALCVGAPCRSSGWRRVSIPTSR
jgi:DNA-binding winged helix-turn-helix (wHTH) protein